VSPVEPDESRESHIYPVERVVDGDTIVVRYEGAETTVRLIGVDTPETVHPNKPVERFGKEASAFTKKTLANASVRLEFDNERFDRYGRLLAYVYRASDELFVNEELIRQGYGHAYTRFPFRHLDRFRQLEAEAREAGRGLWSEGSREPATSPTGDVVYVTATGRKYHRVDCRLLRGNAKAIPLSEARASYEPCAVCTPPR
jgi:micrococcal nuclease